MEYNVKRVLEFKLDDEEIDVFLDVLDSVQKKANKIGFGKFLSTDGKTLVDNLHHSLIGQHEEDSDQSDS